MTISYTKVVATENGGKTIPMAQAEIDQWNADTLASQARKAADDATEVQWLKDKNSGEAKLLAVGLTMAEIKAIKRDK